MYGARKNLISFDDISPRIPRLSASNLNIRRVIEKKTSERALRKLLMVIAPSLAILFPKKIFSAGSGVFEHDQIRFFKVRNLFSIMNEYLSLILMNFKNRNSQSN